jgi:serine protease Do
MMTTGQITRFFFLVLLCLTLPVQATEPVQATDGGLANLRQTSKAFAEIARSVSPSVVFVQVETKGAGSDIGGFSFPFGDQLPFGDDFLKRFFGDGFHGLPRRSPHQGEHHAIGQGSGFVFAGKGGLLSDKTYLLTNNHLVENAEEIRVKLQDGRELDAKVTGRDPRSDVAVIEIPVGGVPVLPLADSSKLEVGEWVVAIGNPFGLSNTLTVGVVSATGRTSVGISDYEDFIQTDAAINPGNSGGPLVNLDGEVVGMNTAIFSRSGGYMGVGFAIPSNLLKAIADQLIEKGEVTRGFLGVVIQQLTPDLADSLGIDVAEGILIAQVNDDSPAAAAGLRAGDVVMAYDGKPVTDIGNFRNRVSLTPPGSQKSLTVLRDGTRKTLTVTIGELSGNELASRGPTHGADEIGLTVQELTPRLAEQLGTRPGEGVVITEVQSGSIAARAGIEPGAVILEVNRTQVNSPAEFRTAVARAGKERGILLLLRQEGTQRFVALRW